MRILSIANHFPPGYTGGAEVANLNTCMGMRARGLEVSVLVVNHRDPRVGDEHYAVADLPVHQVTLKPASKRSALNDLFDMRVYRVVRDELLRVQPDIAHIHNLSGSSLAPFAACQQLGIPTVATLHDLWMLCPNNMRYRADQSFCSPRQFPQGCQDCFRRYDYWADVPRRVDVIRQLTRGVRRFIAPSYAVIERHVEAGFERERFRMVRHGLPAPRPGSILSPALTPFLSTIGQRPTILFAGGGVEIKGAGVIVQALPLLLRYLDQPQIIIVGGGEAHYLERFQSFAPTVTVLGRLPFHEMHPLFTIADLTLMPSICHEALGLVILESYQGGTPVVATNFAGMAEIVDDGQSGYLFPLGDAVALVERVIRHFTQSPLARRQMREYARHKVQTELSLESHLDGVMEVYREVLAA